ncbi:MAG: trigger factor [SAR202 cluster bacterium]|nr:trigger factor [SAR202 cluster bacterium]
MKVTRESATPTEVTLNVQMESGDEDQFLNRSYRRVVGRLRIPGFRPGKAPRSIVESYIGRTGLVQEALEFMVPETLDKVIREENLKAFSEPQIEVTEMEPVSFKAVVPLEPVVDLGDFRAIRLRRDPVEVTESQIGEVVERLRRDSAPWEPVTRPVQFGDLVNLDVTGTIGEETVLKQESVDYLPQQDNALPFPGFSAQLEGMTEGQTKEFTLPVPQDYPNAEYAGKECAFHVAVKSLKEKKLAALDDEFAKGVGEGFADLAALRAHLQDRMTKEAENIADRNLEERSLQELLKVASLQVSDLLYQREVQQMREERERSLRNQRLDMDTYLSFIGKSDAEYTEQLRPQAEERLRRYMVMKKLAEVENVQVSAEEIQEEVNNLAESSGESAQAMRRALASSSAQESLRSSIQMRKVMQRLLEIVQQPDGQGSPAESQPSAAAPAAADPSNPTA